MQSNLVLKGHLSARVIRAPKVGIGWKLRNLRYMLPGLAQHAIRCLFGLSGLEGRLYVRHIAASGRVTDYGLVSCRVVTDAFVEFMVDELQAETSVWGDFKYHDSGEGVGAELPANVGLGSPWGGARSVGTQAEAAANIYQSVATTAYTGPFAITEHGLFSAAAGVTLMDRHLFAAINVVNLDSIQFTYQLTCTSGG